MVDLEGAEPAPLPPPFGRGTDAITLLLISENGSVLRRRHRQTNKQVTATHQSLSLSSDMSCKNNTYEVTRLKQCT